MQISSAICTMLYWIETSPTEPKTTVHRAGCCSRMKSDFRNVHGFCVTLGLIETTHLSSVYYTAIVR